LGYQEIIGAITVAVAICTYTPYLYETIKGKLKPHPFTWIIWTTLAVIGYSAQISDNAGPGSWMNGATITICIFIVFVSIKNGFDNIKQFDLMIFGMGVLAIILWMITNNALWSVIIVSFANTIAYIPTFRKSYNKPQEEAIYLYGINFFRHGASIFALSNLSVITALFPISLTLCNGTMALYLLWRRKSLR